LAVTGYLAFGLTLLLPSFAGEVEVAVAFGE
jgi:hypothetical protein